MLVGIAVSVEAMEGTEVTTIVNVGDGAGEVAKAIVGGVLGIAEGKATSVGVTEGKRVAEG